MPTNKTVTHCYECVHCFEDSASTTGYFCRVHGDEFIWDADLDGFCHKGKSNTTFALKRDGSKIVSNNKIYLERVLSQLKQCADWYGVVTLADLKDIVNRGWTVKDSRYGWVEHMFKETKVTQTLDGWVLELPRAALIE